MLSRHFVFAAGLVILSNEFASLYHNPEADKAIKSCISILHYCAENDKQVDRECYVIESFNQANINRPAQAHPRKLALPGRKIPTINAHSQSSDFDPMLYFFQHSRHTKTSPRIREQPGHIRPIKRERPSVSGVPAPPPRPSAIQQPSPDGGGASPANSSNIPPSIHCLDGLGRPEAEFDFDSLWPSWQGPPNAMALSHHQTQRHNEDYTPYGMCPPQMSLGSALSANANVPLYPTANFH